MCGQLHFECIHIFRFTIGSLCAAVVHDVCVVCVMRFAVCSLECWFLFHFKGRVASNATTTTTTNTTITSKIAYETDKNVVPICRRMCTVWKLYQLFGVSRSFDRLLHIALSLSSSLLFSSSPSPPPPTPLSLFFYTEIFHRLSHECTDWFHIWCLYFCVNVLMCT